MQRAASAQGQRDTFSNAAEILLFSLTACYFSARCPVAAHPMFPVGWAPRVQLAKGSGTCVPNSKEQLGQVMRRSHLLRWNAKTGEEHFRRNAWC